MNTETTPQTTDLFRALGPGSQALDPISAVTAPDPYPYYANLTARRALYYDEGLRMWIASSAAVVESILNGKTFHVRPMGEAVPTLLTGTRAGDIFGRLLRMTDGSEQAVLKRATCNAFALVDTESLLLRSETWMQHLLQVFPQTGPQPDLPTGIQTASIESAPDITFSLPVYVLGSLLGVPSDLLPRCVLWIEAFVRSIAPGGTPEQIERGNAAAEALAMLFQGLLEQAQFPDYKNPKGQPMNLGLLSSFARSACSHAGHDEGVIVANAIGFLSQSYEATAGLIGNLLIALVRMPELRRAVVAEPGLLGAVVGEVARHDSPVQNTRRFLAEDTVVAGHEMRAGDAVLLVLAAANRDPAVNPDPDRFDPKRSKPAVFTFSAGAHVCPGAKMALALAQGAVRQTLASPIDLERLVARFGYRRSQNGRIPLLDWQSACG